MDIRIGAANMSAMELGRMPGAAAAGFPKVDQALNDASPMPAGLGGTTELGPNFMDTLSDAVQSVQGLQADASTKVRQMLTGADGGELHTTMIAVEKADLSFQLMMQVRNKIVQAYQEVARMPF